MAAVIVNSDTLVTASFGIVTNHQLSKPMAKDCISSVCSPSEFGDPFDPMTTNLSSLDYVALVID